MCAKKKKFKQFDSVGTTEESLQEEAKRQAENEEYNKEIIKEFQKVTGPISEEKINEIEKTVKERVQKK
ncbi:hypothetical protein HC823_02230 [Candidatus Gracilibacteria bacterium]|nr:hypothetical protein [Candidatus Gracilibacteria bacterium]